MWAETWRALKAANLADNMFLPTTPLIEGRYQVVFIGDLVHYKDFDVYAKVVGVEYYDFNNEAHLKRAAKTQIRDLYRFKTFVDKSCGNATVILGNHDEDAVTHEYGLTTRGGLKHNEFNPELGGIALPDDIRDWFSSFAREKLFYNVQFAHAGPLPSMQYFDDFFYNDRDSKHWWKEKPHLVKQARHRFGVYGHTAMEDGIYLDKENNFAMIDALSHHQYFEMILDEERLDYRIVKFQ